MAFALATATATRSPATSLVGAAALVAVVLAAAAAAASTGVDAGSGRSRYPPLAAGLSFDYYQRSCPRAESVVRGYLAGAIRKDVGLAAALIRLHFHDCFVHGCDGSILLEKTAAAGKSEQEAIPNLTLRPSAFRAVNDIRALLQRECGGGLVVSCADIVTLAARDSVRLAGGPEYKVPLGRRDSLGFATETEVLAALPPPTSDVTTLLSFLSKISLDADDLVALSGGHTVGIAHCSSFEGRLYPTQDGTMDKWFAGHLKLTCPAKGAVNTTANDIRTPDVFDNKYYVDLQNRQGLFVSDQDMYTDGRTRPIVKRFAVDQAAFFDQFVFSMVKMGQINPLTGKQGQIRANCSVRNVGTTGNDESDGDGNGDGGEMPWSVVETAAAESLVL